MDETHIALRISVVAVQAQHHECPSLLRQSLYSRAREQLLQGLDRIGVGLLPVAAGEHVFDTMALRVLHLEVQVQAAAALNRRMGQRGNQDQSRLRPQPSTATGPSMTLNA